MGGKGGLKVGGKYCAMHSISNRRDTYQGQTREKGLQDRLEELKEEKKEAEQLNSLQADRIKQLKEALKQSKVDAQQLRIEKERYAVEAGRGEMVMQRIINKYLPTFVRRLHQSAEYKRSLGEVFSLAIGKGIMNGISIGHEDADVRAILQATPNVDPASSDIFMDAYEKLFEQIYSYVDKVARMYLLDPNSLQNIMPDETGPTPGGDIDYASAGVADRLASESHNNLSTFVDIDYAPSAGKLPLPQRGERPVLRLMLLLMLLSIQTRSLSAKALLRPVDSKPSS
nr:hypothetical protein [Tanacetum cinerariifolium]